MWSECYMIAVSIANKVLVTLNGFFGFLIFFFFSLVGKKGALCFCSIILVLHLFLSSMYLLTISFLTFLCRFLKAIDRFNDLVVSAYVTAGHILSTCGCFIDGIKFVFLSWEKVKFKIYFTSDTDIMHWWDGHHCLDPVNFYVSKLVI